MIIRRAAAADAEQINNLLFQVAKIHADGRPDIFKKATKKYSDEELAEIIRNDETPIFAAEEDGRILGYAFCVYQSTKGSLLMQDKKPFILTIFALTKTTGESMSAKAYLNMWKNSQRPKALTI